MGEVGERHARIVKTLPVNTMSLRLQKKKSRKQANLDPSESSHDARHENKHAVGSEIKRSGHNSSPRDILSLLKSLFWNWFCKLPSLSCVDSLGPSPSRQARLKSQGLPQHEGSWSNAEVILIPLQPLWQPLWSCCALFAVASAASWHPPAVNRQLPHSSTGITWSNQTMAVFFFFFFICRVQGHWVYFPFYFIVCFCSGIVIWEAVPHKSCHSNISLYFSCF